MHALLKFDIHAAAEQSGWLLTEKGFCLELLHVQVQVPEPPPPPFEEGEGLCEDEVVEDDGLPVGDVVGVFVVEFDILYTLL